MKNFKKVLALVLAIATLLSFATVASAATADFKDAADIKYTEAVDVLSAIKVLEGYPADNTYKPAKNITREEAAKIIAIFANKSADISSLYTSANPFADEKGRWGESYVAYGYRAGIIAGKSATQFKPTANVKGTEFLKMVLVVLGYDQNKEGLVGSSWAVNTLELAKAKSLMAGLPSTWDANAALTRDEAAQIMLNALKAETVVYGQTVTNLVYNTATKTWGVTNATSAAAVYVSPNGAQNNYNHTLLAAGFGLTLAGTQDAWGRPTHTWTKGATVIGEYVDSDKLLATFKTAATECDIAKAAGFKANKVLDLYVNGNKSTDTVRPTATTTYMGAQGRLTEVYTDRIVMIDTFLAKVTDVTVAKYDAAGHKVNDATITLTVYDVPATRDNNVDTTSNVNATVVMLSSAVNYTYAKGDYVLVNAKTKDGQIGRVNVMNTRTTSGKVETDATLKYAEIAGKATSVEGAQSVIWYNGNQHTVEGTTYADAMKFYLDEANTSTAKHTWFLDAYGNLIGDVKVANVYTYGVITKLWNNNDNSVGSGKTMATVKYMDGTENTVEVASFTLGTNTYAPTYGMSAADNMNFVPAVAPATVGTVKVSGNIATNAADDANATTVDAGKADVIDGHLFQMSTLADGTVAFTRVAGELTNTAVTNKGAYIAGVKVDATTKFLYATPVLAGVYNLKGTYEYKTANGMNEVPTFKAAGSKIDYVDVNNDGVADYVYIIGENADTTTNDFLYVVSAPYSAQLKTNGGIAYYEMALPVPAEDGSVATVKVAVADYDEIITKGLAAAKNYGKLFYAKTVNGFVTELVEIATSGTTPTIINSNPTTTATMPYQYAAATKPNSYAVKVMGATYSEAGKVIEATTPGKVARYNITDATVIVGKDLLSATMKAEDVVLYVIYTQDATDPTTKVAEKIYISAVTPNQAPGFQTTALTLTVGATAPVANTQLGNLTVETKTKAASETVKNVVDVTATWCKLDTASGKLVEVTNDTFADGNSTYVVKVTVNSVNPNYTLAAGDIKVNTTTVTPYAGTSNVYYSIVH